MNRRSFLSTLLAVPVVGAIAAKFIQAPVLPPENPRFFRGRVAAQRTVGGGSVTMEASADGQLWREVKMIMPGPRYIFTEHSVYTVDQGQIRVTVNGQAVTPDDQA